MFKSSKFTTFLSPHPNFVQIFDAFEDIDFFFIVLDLCEPITLFDHIADGPLSEPEAASLIKQLLEALTLCHRHGIAHRDIKLENMLFDSRGNVKATDFGSAEWFSDGRNMSGVVGTPYYVAPEVLLGREYNEKVDVWKSGVILYKMLVGIPPIDGDSAVEIFGVLM